MSLGLLAMESGWHTCVLKYDGQDSTGGCQPNVIGFRIAYFVLRTASLKAPFRSTIKLNDAGMFPLPSTPI